MILITTSSLLSNSTETAKLQNDNHFIVYNIIFFFLRLQDWIWRRVWRPDGPGGQKCRWLGTQ